MSYFIYTDLICTLLDPKLVDPGSILIYVGAYDPKWRELNENLNIAKLCKNKLYLDFTTAESYVMLLE